MIEKTSATYEEFQKEVAMEKIAAIRERVKNCKNGLAGFDDNGKMIEIKPESIENAGRDR